MDRFFSKLDLRDIKIDPFKTSFPPDADEAEQVDAGEATEPTEVPAGQTRDEPAPASGWGRSDRRPHVPAWAAPSAADEPAPPAVNGYAGPAASAAGAQDEVDVPTQDWAAEGPQGGEVLKVSARSRPSAVAGAIAGVVREAGRAEVQAIGAGATNQAVKAVAIARDYLRETGIEVICLPAFIDVTIDNEDRTAIRLVVEPR